MHLFQFFLLSIVQYDKENWSVCILSNKSFDTKTLMSKRRDHKDIDPTRSLRLCLEGLHPEVCLALSFICVINESELRDLLRLLELELGPDLVLELELLQAETVIHNNSIFSIHVMFVKFSVNLIQEMLSYIFFLVSDTCAILSQLRGMRRWVLVQNLWLTEAD